MKTKRLVVSGQRAEGKEHGAEIGKWSFDAIL